MQFLEKTLFPIGSFDVLVWHLLVLIAIILVIAVIVIIAVVARKKARQNSEVPVAETQPASVTEVAQDEQPADEQPSAQPAEEQPAAEQPAQEQPAAQDDVTVTEEEDEEPDEDEEPATEEEAAQEEKDAEKEAADRKRPKNYHISLRADGKWQVKLSKGAKPLKLFDTQAQAIAFAKEKAKNQEGTITIHKVNGQIRKQKY